MSQLVRGLNFVRPIGVGQFFQDVFATTHEEAFRHSKNAVMPFNKNQIPNE